MATERIGSYPVGPAKERMKLLVFPREHGAWGILLVPLATGAAAALAADPRQPLALLPFLALVLSLFLLRTPLEALLKSSPLRPATAEERRAVWKAIAGYGSAAAVALAALLAMAPARALWQLAAPVGLAFLLQTMLKRGGKGRERRVSAQMVGSIGLTATAPGAYIVVTGRLDATALALWALNFAFAAEQIAFVQMRIASARPLAPADKFWRASTLLLGQMAGAGVLAMAAALRLIPAAVLLGFVPLLARSAWWVAEGPKPLSVRRLGFTELAYALVFGAVVSAAYVAR